MVTTDRLTDKRVMLATVMKIVTRCIDLKKIGDTVRTTRTTTRIGSILLEVDSSEDANTIAEKVRQTVAGKARVTHIERGTLIALRRAQLG